MAEQGLPHRDGQQHRHHQGDEGENPGVVGEQGEGGPRVLHIGQVQEIGEEGHMLPQGDILDHQILHQLVQGHQNGRKNGI